MEVRIDEEACVGDVQITGFTLFTLEHSYR